MVLNVHSLLHGSRANGPGPRTVIWVQGCSLRCPGCFNPDTHSSDPRQLMPVEDLVRRLRQDEPAIEGLTLSGGEPLDQAEAVAELLRRVRQETGLSMVLFTGYTWEEVQADERRKAAVACADVVLAGRYDGSRRLAHGLRGSQNKTLHCLTGRYAPGDFDDVPVGEVVIGPDGDITVSGIEPPRLDSPR